MGQKEVGFRMMNEWLQKKTCVYLFVILTACAGPKEKRPPEIQVRKSDHGPGHHPPAGYPQARQRHHRFD
jgi:hypothetical protein